MDISISAVNSNPVYLSCFVLKCNMYLLSTLHDKSRSLANYYSVNVCIDNGNYLAKHTIFPYLYCVVITSATPTKSYQILISSEFKVLQANKLLGFHSIPTEGTLRFIIAPFRYALPAEHMTTRGGSCYFTVL